MKENNKTFWCQNCQKKYFLPENMVLQQQRSNIMKKPPFFDHFTKNGEPKTELKMEEQKKLYKCITCGHLMKEIQNGGSDNGS
jgi:DNA-directed RNA polymerase subunit RPC12/RpoP